MNYYSFIYVLILLCLLTFIEADVKLLFTVRDYENRNNLDSRLRKCEALSFFGDNCDPIFQLTVHVINERDERQLLLRRDAGPYSNKKVVKEVLQTSSALREFPQLLEIDLDIHDNDVDEDQLIAQYRRIIPLLKTGQMDLRMGADVKVNLLIDVECAENFYGEKCQIFCQPSPQLWNCNSVTGARICTKPCIHGSCILTNTSAVCACAPGWTGEFCKMPSESTLITSMLLPEEPPDPISNQELSGGVDDFGVGEDEHLSSTKLNGVFSYVTTPAISGAENSSSVEDKQVTFLNNQAALQEPLVVRNVTEGESVYGKNLSNIKELEFEYHSSNLTILAAGRGKNKQEVYLISLVAAITITIFLAILIVATVLFYRRWSQKRGSDHSGSIWTNVSYDLTQSSNLKPFTLDFQSGLHKYENTVGSPQQSIRTNSTLCSQLTSQHLFAGIRASLPNIPNDHSENCMPPPVVTGSKIRFSAIKVLSHSPSHERLVVSPPKVLNDTEPYDELSGQSGDEYTMWEPEAVSKTTNPDRCDEHSDILKT